jgi:Ran GTPase-activating protein 1
MAAGVVFSMEGRGLKLNTAEDVRPFVEELAGLANVTEIRLSGNTFNVEAAEALALRRAGRPAQSPASPRCFPPGVVS